MSATILRFPTRTQEPEGHAFARLKLALAEECQEAKLSDLPDESLQYLADMVRVCLEERRKACRSREP